MTDDLREQIQRLEELVAGPAGALAFPALAEAHRRAGRPEAAERVAREGLERAPHVTAGRVALALSLLDQKRDDETRAELERLLGGETEHAIAHDAAAHETPEGVGMLGAPIRGEIATLDPYPDEEIPRADEEASRGSTGPVFPAFDAQLAAVIDEAPDMAIEPAASGPFGPPPPPVPAEPLVFDADDVGDDELDSAFDQAEADREQMFGADDVAHAALSAVPDEEEGEAELDPMGRAEVADGEDDFASRAEFGAGNAFAADGLDPILSIDDDRDDDDDEAEALAAAPGSPFATETFAGLLERQGHVEDAKQLRERIAGEPEASPADPETQAADGGSAKQATLERWLDNLRRDTR